ncbi:MAG: NAD-dependent epimerase/dehydratase family protein [Rhodoferax sp.]
MPSNQSPLGALPARFRRERVLLIGCGDVGMRARAVLGARVRVLALTSSAQRVPTLRQLGMAVLQGDLDAPQTLRRLAGLATRVLHLAPPPADGDADTRTRALAQVLRRRSAARSLVYASTSGVYGDCEGQWIDETRPLRPASPRALRRVDAERQIRRLGAATRVGILRIPGIYAADRPDGTPHARLLRGMPVLHAEDDVYTNHIHADDLARACVLALWRGAPQRVYHVNDDSSLKMADYYDAAADLYGLARPERVDRASAAQRLSPMTLSFMSESRRMRNRRLKLELRLRLRYPSVLDGLAVGG